MKRESQFSNSENAQYASNKYVNNACLAEKQATAFKSSAFMPHMGHQ